MKNKTLLTKFLIICISIFSFQGLLSKSFSVFNAEYVVFSKDKSQLIYLSRQQNGNKTSIIKTSVKDGAILKNIPLKLNNQLIPFAATPDGFKFLATSPPGIAVIHNGTGKVLRTLPYPTKLNHVDPFLFQQSQDGVLLAMPVMIPNSGKIYLIHTGSGKLQHTVDVLKGEKWSRHPTIQGIGFSQKRRYIAYVYQTSDQSILRVYDLYKKVETLRLKLPYTKHQSGEIQFSKNGRYLLFSAVNLTQTSLIDLKQQSVKTVATGYYDFAGFPPDDQNLIFIQSRKNKVLVKNIKTGKTTIRAIKFQNKNSSYVTSRVIQSADRSMIALSSRTSNHKKVNQFLLINGSSGQLLREIGK